MTKLVSSISRIGQTEPFQLQTNSGTHEMNVFGEGILLKDTI